MKKTILALLLVVALVITVSAVTVSAAKPTAPAQLWSELTVAADGKTATGYCPHCCATTSDTVTWTGISTTTTATVAATLTEAGHYFLNGNTFGVLQPQCATGDIILHLNGNTHKRLSAGGNATGAIRFRAAGSLYILDSKENGTGTIDGDEGWAITTYGNKATITLYSGTITADCNRTIATTIDTSLTSNGTWNKDTQTTTGGNGGLIRIGSVSTFNMFGGKLVGTKAYNGGAIYANGTGTTVNLMGGEITANDAATYGGAIYVAAGSNLNIYNTKIYGTSATYGGAIYAVSSWNDTSKVATEANILLENGTIENCYATNRAGAIMLTGSASGAYTNFDMTGGTIRNCFIKDGSTTEFGGNLYVEYGEVDMTGGTIENGGIPAQGQTVTPDKTHQGGNICVRGNSVVNISGTATVQNGGNAKYGANIFLNIGSANITGGTIGGVSANSIYLANTNTSRLTIDGATVKGIGDGNETNVASRLSIWFAGAKPNTSTAPITLGAYTGLLTLNPDVSNDSLANYPVGMVVNNVTLNEHYDLEKEIFIYDSSSSRKPLAVNADKKLQIAGLTGIKKADGVAVPVTEIDNTAGTYAYYEIYTAGTYTMKSDAVIDPNNRTCTIDNTNFKLSLIDNRTRDFEVDEQLRSGISVTNPDNLEPIGVNELTGERFLVVDSGLTDANGNPYYTANYLEVELKTVSLKTNKADLYYTTAVKSNYLGAKAVEQYGVAFSLKAPVGDDFHMENVYNTNGILFTVNEYVAEDKTMLDETAVSALVENVLVEGAEDNAERAELTIYASAYVKVKLFNGNVAYVMSTADTDFNYHQIIEKLDTQLGADATKFEGKESVITGFYNAWLAPLNWELPNIKALAAA